MFNGSVIKYLKLNQFSFKQTSVCHIHWIGKYLIDFWWKMNISLAYQWTDNSIVSPLSCSSVYFVVRWLRFCFPLFVQRRVNIYTFTHLEALKIPNTTWVSVVMGLLLIHSSWPDFLSPDCFFFCFFYLRSVNNWWVFFYLFNLRLPHKLQDFISAQ